jgi:Na+-transporting NADH:ubiquinone oxidoreductase subunit NqrF
MYTLIVFGNASKSNVATINISPKEKLTNLLQILMDHKIPIASSCFGEGVCQKCVINDGLLACKTTFMDLLQGVDSSQNIITISLDYL